MLTVTQGAARRMQSFLDRRGDSHAGIRIFTATSATGDERRATLQMQVVPDGEPDDALVVGPEGVHLFLEPEVVALLDRRTLDVQEVNGHEALFLTARQEPS